MNQQEKISILSALFVSLLVLTNLMGTKITTIAGLHFSVALFAFPFTFLITDIIAEVKGRQSAHMLVRSSFIALIVVLLMSLLFLSLPFSARSFIKDEYSVVFSATVRILVASVVSFYLSQTHDVRAFAFWKKKTAGKYLWIRNNLSTIVSQAIDTLLFYTIAFLYVPIFPAFLNTSSDYTFLFVLHLAFPYYGLKVFMALCDTPLVYVGVKWLCDDQKNPSIQNKK